MSDYTDSSNPTQAGRDLCATGRHHFEDGGPCLRCSEPAPLDGAPSGETPEDNRETPWAASGWMDPVPQNTQPPRVREIPPAIQKALNVYADRLLSPRPSSLGMSEARAALESAILSALPREEPAPSGEALEALGRLKEDALAYVPRLGHDVRKDFALVRRRLSGLHRSTPERLREVRAMEAFIDAIWFNVLCARPLEPPPALLDAWAALDSALGVWYWSCQPGCLNPQNPEAAPPSPPKEG